MAAPRPPHADGPGSVLGAVLTGALGAARAGALQATVAVDPHVAGPSAEAWGAHAGPSQPEASRVTIAQALALVLFDDLCERVPSAAGYVRDRQAAGRQLVLDHGAVRTVTGPCGALPAGQEQVARLLRPLGYEHRETYDLAALGMTGHSWAHRDAPEAVPQWFVSELHLDRLTPEVQEATGQLLATSTDALGPLDQLRAQRLEVDEHLPIDDAAALVAAFARCFDRRHDEPTDRDHDLLARESAELAWIATEGTTCNHWTDRVADVAAAAEAERVAGRPVKDVVEVSASGRVRQTAHRAATVERRFHTVEGDGVVRAVPGSFFELIERAPLPDGSGLDLAFDAANATGIFAMTRPVGSSGILGGDRRPR